MNKYICNSYSTSIAKESTSNITAYPSHCAQLNLHVWHRYTQKQILVLLRLLNIVWIQLYIISSFLNPNCVQKHYKRLVCTQSCIKTEAYQRDGKRLLRFTSLLQKFTYLLLYIYLTVLNYDEKSCSFAFNKRSLSNLLTTFNKT